MPRKKAVDPEELTPEQQNPEQQTSYEEPVKQETLEKETELPSEAAVASEIPDEYPEELAKEEPAAELSDRQKFFALNFNELDRALSPEERKEWNSLYASYRGRSVLHGRVIGVDELKLKVWNRQTNQTEQKSMLCAIIVPYRVRIIIPASEMWDTGTERPDYVMKSLIGANLDFIIIKLDRENCFAVASRRMAMRARRYYFARRPMLNQTGAKIQCKLLSVGPRRCLAECYGHDIEMTQRDLRYSAIPDLRDEYHPGQELDCIVKSYDAAADRLHISVKEVEANPFDGAIDRHPIGSRRLAKISGKYGGGVFCNLPDGTVCMCNYSYQHDDSDFVVGDTVILTIQNYDMQKKQVYGKILSRWS